MTSKTTIIVTDHAEFLRAVRGDEIRYFPSNGVNARVEAAAYDEDRDYDNVRGFGVYDTTISTSYAVALYATKAEAEAHEPAPVPAKPLGIFKSPGINGKGNKPRRR